MKKNIIIPLTLLLSQLLCGCWGGEPLEDMYARPAFQSGEGIVVFKEYAPLRHKPVNLYYYIPEGDMKTMPVLFVLPGVNRNAADYRKCWKQGADRKKVMIFSLEFPADFYTSEEYNEGGMLVNNTIKPEKEWSFSVIEPIFEYICSQLNGTQQTFDLWGHSAGAQFVHRFILFKPEAPIGKAVSANAGWYTVPDLTVDFPYGLKNSPAGLVQQKEAFAKNLIIHLGTADTNPDDPNLNHSPGAELQGKHRYERGLYFWENSVRISELSGNLNWIKHEVNDVAHDYVKMAAAAVDLMY